MPELNSLIGAFIATYALSRLTWRALPWLSPLVRLAISHAGSLFVLTIAVGFIKSYFTSFAFDRTLVLIGPALFWFALDWMRGKAAQPARQGTSTRGSRAR